MSLAEYALPLREAAPAGTSVTSGQWTSIASVELPPGLWLVVYAGAFSSNSTGRRALHVGANTSAGRYSPTCQAVNGDQTRLTGVRLLRKLDTSSWHLYAWQNSGATLTTYGAIQAVRLSA